MVEQNMNRGVTVIGAETSSNYHVASRIEAPPQPAVLPAGIVTPASAGMSGSTDKKKRGRPRKYGPDGGGAPRMLSPMPISSSAPPAAGGHPGPKRGRGKSVAKQQPGFDLVSMTQGLGRTDGANFTPHVITIGVGEDVTAKIISFCQQGPRAVCILSASGMVSNATLRQSDSSGGTLTYEGRFDIVNLCGSYTPTGNGANRAGGLSVSLSSPNGQLVGGTVAGLLIAATSVQVIVGSFLPSLPSDLKPKKPKPQSVPAPFTITGAGQPQMPPPSVPDKDAGNGQGHNNSVASMQNLTPPTSFQRENWPHTHMQERRPSTTDINISLPGGMH